MEGGLVSEDINNLLIIAARQTSSRFPNKVLKTIDGLREDPIFIDTIHGEQELSLDQTIELFNGIRSHFVVPDSPEAKAPGFETNSFDVS